MRQAWVLTLSNELCLEAIFFDSLDLIFPGLSALQVNLQLSHKQRQVCFKGIVDSFAFKGTTANIFFR